LIYSLKLCTNRFATPQNRRFMRLSLRESSPFCGPDPRYREERGDGHGTPAGPVSPRLINFSRG